LATTIEKWELLSGNTESTTRGGAAGTQIKQTDSYSASKLSLSISLLLAACVPR